MTAVLAGGTGRLERVGMHAELTTAHRFGVWIFVACTRAHFIEVDSRATSRHSEGVTPRQPLSRPVDAAANKAERSFVKASLCCVDRRHRQQQTYREEDSHGTGDHRLKQVNLG
jgi:hypothetical protein